MRRGAWAGMSIVMVAGLAFAQQTQRLTHDLDRIAATVQGGEAGELLRQLTDDIGPRVVGSPGYTRAVAWAMQRFRMTGLANVRQEDFTLPNGWQRGPAHARMVTPVARLLRIESVGWSPSTPTGGIRGRVILVGDLSPTALRSRSAELRNGIVLVDLEKALPPNEPLAFARLRDSYALFAELGSQAVLLPSDVPNNVSVWVDTGNARGTILPLPVGDIGLEDNGLLRRYLRRGPVTIEAEWTNEITGPVQVSNVVAEIPGVTRPNEWVLLGAHLDSWDLGTGAQDNGTGVVMVLEAARAIASLGTSPRRTIRFVLWAAEEPGPPGSAMFIKRHAAELHDCVAAVNTDNGAGRPRGWYVHGRTDLRDSMGPIAQYLRKFKASGLSRSVECRSDDCPFILEGVPALKLWVEMSQYPGVHHRASDTFDKVDLTSLRAGATVVATTTYAITEQRSRIAPHIAPGAVRRILRDAKIDVDLMTALWKP